MSRTYQDKAIKQSFKDVRGFALPTILIGSIVMLIVLVGAVTATTATRTALNEQYYDQLAQAAGDAGVAYAKACLNANAGTPQWSNATPLMPNTDCSGNPVGGYTCPSTTDTRCSVMLNGNIRSSFSVGAPTLDTDGRAVTIPNNGFVDILRTSNSAVWRTYKQQAAQPVVAPGLCSANTTSALGWNTAVTTTSAAFPEPSAIPITLASGDINPGPVYLRKDFSITKPGIYTMQVLADNIGDVSIDGQPFMTGTWVGGVASKSASLTVGCHSIIVELTNISITSNPASLTLSLKLNGSSTPLVVSDKSWRVAAGNSVSFASVNYYADPASWTVVRDAAYANTYPTWTPNSGDIAARVISTTHSYDGSGNYPAYQYALFRDNRVITVTSPTQVKLSYTCDDSCAIYLDGNVVANGNGSVVGTTTLTLSEGSHRFGVAVYNVTGSSSFAFAALRNSDNYVLTHTDTVWSAANFWSPTVQSSTSYDNTYTPNPDSSNVRVLVVAGGGSGGGSTGGGGGGGGVIPTTQGVAVGNYPVVVGAGGAIPGNASTGKSGANSTFNGLVAIGGGGGGWSGIGAGGGLNGGSGGGGQNYSGIYQSGVGTQTQGNPGGAVGNGSASGGGGAGGSGVSNQTAYFGGGGGPGLPSNISGATVYYGAGGGGGNGGIGGVGGGGNGSDVGAAGTANTGAAGGGGWSYATGNGGAGGSGVVIISYPTGKITASGGTITTSGGNTIHTFTSSGTFTVTAVQ